MHIVSQAANALTASLAIAITTALRLFCLLHTDLSTMAWACKDSEEDAAGT
jgi:hypothetical protein